MGVSGVCGGYGICAIVAHLTQPLVEIVWADARETLNAALMRQELETDLSVSKQRAVLTWVIGATLALPLVLIALSVPKSTSILSAMNILTALMAGLAIGSAEFTLPRVSWIHFFLWTGTGLTLAVFILSMRLHGDQRL